MSYLEYVNDCTGSRDVETSSQIDVSSISTH